MSFLADSLTKAEAKLAGSNGYHKVKNRTGHIIFSCVRAAVLLGMAFVLLYPLLYMLSLTFRPASQMLDPVVVWVPKSFTLKNLFSVSEALELSKSMPVTLFVGIGSALVHVCSCSLAGYGFARFDFKFKKILFGIVIFTIIVPPQLLMIPQYIQYRYFDFFFLGQIFKPFMGKAMTMSILNTPLAFYIPALFSYGIRSGLLIYIFRQFFKGLPKELEDAAHIDGCGPIKCFVRVMVPNSGSAFLTVFLFSVVWYWNDYFYSGTFIPELRTLSVRLTSLAQSLGVEYATYAVAPQMQAGCFLVILPPLLMYLIFQRYFTESIERTGIVG